MSSAILVAGPRAEDWAARLREHGIESVVRPRFDDADLPGTDVVCLLGEPGGPVPEDAAAVLAAGRVLVVNTATPDRGFQNGVHLLVAASPDSLVVYARAATEHPHAFAPLRAFGRIAARHSR